MARDSAYYRADSRTGNRARDSSRALAGIARVVADGIANASANQRAGGGAVNSAPTHLALLRASAQEQRDAGPGR